MNYQGLVGVLFLIGVAYLLSEKRREVPWIRIGVGLLATFFIGLVCSFFPPLAQSLLGLNKFIYILEESALHGASFIFGYLAGSPAPFEVKNPGNMFIIAFRVFPLILFVGVLSNFALHLGIMGKVIQWMAIPVRKVFKLSPELALGAASSVFFGTIETPMLIKGWLKGLSRGEMMALLACTMSTIAGTVMVLYASVLRDVLPGAAGHMMVASFMNVPCALAISLIMIPFSPLEDDQRDLEMKSPFSDLGDALSSGIQEGLGMILSIIGTLIVLFALIHLINTFFGMVPGLGKVEELLAYPLRPVMWMVGIPWAESFEASTLMAEKIVLNEFVGYLKLSGMKLSEKSTVTMTYALCGFANLGSLGILIGGMGQLLPERKKELVALGIKSLIAGNIATLMSAALISLIL